MVVVVDAIAILSVRSAFLFPPSWTCTQSEDGPVSFPVLAATLILYISPFSKSENAETFIELKF